MLFKKIAEQVKMIGDRQITHRDLHLNNVMLHMPSLELTEKELNEGDILQVLDEKEREYGEIVSDESKFMYSGFETRLIDFGLSRMVEGELS